MFIVLSPAKKLDETPTTLQVHSQPRMLEDTKQLVDTLGGYSEQQLSELMGISEKLAKLNHGRYQAFETPFTTSNAKQALLMFAGDTYRDIPLDAYTDEDFAFAQERVRILSGLYGSLRPLDLMQPYRLEMGTKMPNERAEDLYGFWGSSIAESLVADMRAAGTKVLVNLASKEYFSSVNTEVLAHAGVRVLEPVFKDYKSGTYKVVSFFAKRARGLMASHIVRHRLTDPEALRGFIEAGYTWNAERSSPDQPVFLRRQE